MRSGRILSFPARTYYTCVCVCLCACALYTSLSSSLSSYTVDVYAQTSRFQCMQLLLYFNAIIPDRIIHSCTTEMHAEFSLFSNGTHDNTPISYCVHVLVYLYAQTVMLICNNSNNNINNNNNIHFVGISTFRVVRCKQWHSRELRTPHDVILIGRIESDVTRSEREKKLKSLRNVCVIHV